MTGAHKQQCALALVCAGGCNTLFCDAYRPKAGRHFYMMADGRDPQL
jgi:prepilin-type processing-associated H-X9-DG protein